jgi:hypothetical protein
MDLSNRPVQVVDDYDDPDGPVTAIPQATVELAKGLGLA